MNRVALLCATQVATAFAARNGASLSDTTDLVATLTGTFANLGKEPVVEVAPAPVPAVSIRKSITDDYIVCLEDGRKMKSLKRHLRTRYNLTPDQYRAKWGLAADYPMVAPGYAARRSEIAKSFGLGVRKPAVKTEAEIAETFKAEGILCLIDQKVVKDLGRHARKHHGVNATAYRERFGLPTDYPMTLEGVETYLNARRAPVALAA